MIEWSRGMRDLSGNLEPSINVYPDRLGPVVRNGHDRVRELVRVRWGLPSSSQALFQATAMRVATDWRRWTSTAS